VIADKRLSGGAFVCGSSKKPKNSYTTSMRFKGLARRKEALLLFLGDLLCFSISLWVALAIRAGAMPPAGQFLLHLQPFIFLFGIWVAVFFIAGLYEKHTMILKGRLPSAILNAQLANSIIAALFFYFIPYFGITPKTVLFLDLVLSAATVVWWRFYGFAWLHPRRRQNAILIGSGPEMKELREEVNANARYSVRFISSIDLDDVESIDFQGEVVKRIYAEEISLIVIDLRNDKVEPILPHLYNLIFSKVRFIDMHRVYEDIFDRIPLSLVRDSWFLENISLPTSLIYDGLKRLMDVVASLVLGVLSLVVYPFVALAIKLDDRGPVFIVQKRIGQGNLPVEFVKFRTMEVSKGGAWLTDEGYKKVTRVGAFLRKTRVDELPQLWNVLRGDVSLIGPRPELPELAALYEKEIAYYGIRHLIKPGLSGWAMMHQDKVPHHAPGLEGTKIKLSYDLYYLKNRSFTLDLKIALRTVKTFLSRSGI
jgi:exopolysaccharide biosynthesis polyprenyl glycosylphosphotransferase